MCHTVPEGEEDNQRQPRSQPDQWKRHLCQKWWPSFFMAQNEQRGCNDKDPSEVTKPPSEPRIGIVAQRNEACEHQGRHTPERRDQATYRRDAQEFDNIE